MQPSSTGYSARHPSIHPLPAASLQRCARMPLLEGVSSRTCAYCGRVYWTDALTCDGCGASRPPPRQASRQQARPCSASSGQSGAGLFGVGLPGSSLSSVREFCCHQRANLTCSEGAPAPSRTAILFMPASRNLSCLHSRDSPPRRARPKRSGPDTTSADMQYERQDRPISGRTARCVGLVSPDDEPLKRMADGDALGRTRCVS